MTQGNSDFAVKVLDTGVIYRNPKPFLRSLQAYFPSVVSLGSGELLASIVIGQAFESVDCRIYLARSMDNGQNWQMQGRLTKLPQEAEYSEFCRIGLIDSRQVAAWVFTHDRSDTEMGLANPENMGFVEIEMSLYRSFDGGRTWSEPEPVRAPLVGPAFELCCPVISLSDGRLMAPTSTWRGWDGSCPEGMKAVNFISYDNGKSWPDYLDVMDDHDRNIIYWEQKTIELENSKLLSVAWAYDELNDCDLENHYAISTEGGRFARPRSTKLKGQTPAVLHLGQNTILTVYRRTDKPGLWANISTVAEDQWVNEFESQLWGNGTDWLQNTHKDKKNMVLEFHELKFGAPCLTQLEDGTILVSFWCIENNVSNIRWIKLKADIEH